MNLHSLAVAVSKREGKKKEVDIAQIKEVLKYALLELKECSVADLIKLLK